MFKNGSRSLSVEIRTGHHINGILSYLRLRKHRCITSVANVIICLTSKVKITGDTTTYLKLSSEYNFS